MNLLPGYHRQLDRPLTIDKLQWIKKTAEKIIAKYEADPSDDYSKRVILDATYETQNLAAHLLRLLEGKDAKPKRKAKANSPIASVS